MGALEREKLFVFSIKRGWLQSEESCPSQKALKAPAYHIFKLYASTRQLILNQAINPDPEAPGYPAAIINAAGETNYVEGRNQLIKEFLGGTVGRIILELFGKQEEKYSAKIFL